jgi:GNAT superfamily N-acetyltransferase
VSDIEPQIATVTLRDGRVAVIRQLTIADASALSEAIERADRFDLRRRFMGAPPPTHVLLRLLAGADGVHDAALGAFDVDGRLVAVAQFDRRDDRPCADVAVEVAKDWQNCGLGHELSVRITALAISRGIEIFTVSYLADNDAVARMVRSTGRSSRLVIKAGQATVTVDLRGIHVPTTQAGSATARP